MFLTNLICSFQSFFKKLMLVYRYWDVYKSSRGFLIGRRLGFVSTLKIVVKFRSSNRLVLRRPFKLAPRFLKGSLRGSRRDARLSTDLSDAPARRSYPFQVLLFLCVVGAGAETSFNCPGDWLENNPHEFRPRRRFYPIYVVERVVSTTCIHLPTLLLYH